MDEPDAASEGRAPFYWHADVTNSFPPAFVAFLRRNDIHPDNYRTVDDVPRYLRVNPRSPLSVEELERQLQARCEPVSWLPGYYKLASHVKIAGTDAYRSGSLYGIDVSSGAAVVALDAQPGEDVLDLCCAPGAKLCAIADAMQLQGTVTGVDVSEQRLAACRTLCQKYGVLNARLVVADGRTFSEPPPCRRDSSSNPSLPAAGDAGRPADDAIAAAVAAPGEAGEANGEVSRAAANDEDGGEPVGEGVREDGTASAASLTAVREGVDAPPTRRKGKRRCCRHCQCGS